MKAGETKNGKIMIFFAFCDHLITKSKGIQYFDVSRSKRPTKLKKVISKARETKNGKIMIFFAFCDHLVIKIKGIQYFDVSRSKRPKRPH